LFAITIVLTDSPQIIRDGLADLRHELRLPVATEFKFHGTPHASRLAFLDRAVTWPLVARTLYVDKQWLPVDLRKLKSWEFYGFFVAQLLDRVPEGELGNTTLILDEFGPPRLTRLAIQEYLRHHGLWGSRAHFLKRIAFRRSQSEDVIQVADMFCGAIYRRLTEGDETYYRLIRNKTLVWAYRPAKTNPPT
jgi:hypothetical protein